MGLDIRALGAVAAKIGLDLAGNAKEEVTLTLGGTRAYVAAADSNALTGAQVITVQALPYKKKEKKSPDNEVTDKKFSARSSMLLIETAALVAAGMTPGTQIRETDSIQRPDALPWMIFSADQDPSGASWILDLRR